MITMKTKLHKLASLLLAFALTLCLALPAGAVEGDGVAAASISPNSKGSITVSGAENGVTVYVYKLMNVNVDATAGQPQEPVYSWVDGVAGWVRANYDTYIGAGPSGTELADNSVKEAFSMASAENVAKFYDALAAAIRSGGANGVTLNPANTSGTIATDGSCTIEKLAMGNYLVLIEGGMKVYRPSAVNIVPKWDETSGTGEWVVDNPTVALKAGDATIEKKVTDTADSTQEKPMTPCDWAQVDIGDTVTYTLTAAVPTFPEDAINKGYQISDTLPEGMTLNNDSFTVYGMTSKEDASPIQLTSKLTADANGGAYYLATRNATRPVDADNDNYLDSVSFNIAFDYDNLKNTTEGAETRYTYVKVTYTATANENIKVFGDSLGDGKGTSTGNENTAYLDYNNNPYQKATDDDPLEWVSKEDSAFVYTYGIKVDKVSDKQESGQDVYLPGAEFTLHRTNSQGNKEGAPISFVAENADDGVYRVAKQADAGSTTKLTVGEENAAEGADSRAGKLDIRGLDVGTYILTETKAPDGYNLPSKAFEIIINDRKTLGSDKKYQDAANGKTDTTDDTNNTTEGDDGYVSTKITNTKGFTLPTTGGMGTVLFTAGGVLLMGAGLVVLVLFLRRRTSR